MNAKTTQTAENQAVMNDQAIYNEFSKENGSFDIILPCGNVVLEFNSKTQEIKGFRTDSAAATTKILGTGLRLLNKTFAFETTYAEKLEQIINEYNENPLSFAR